jgi:hypothetical protein
MKDLHVIQYTGLFTGVTQKRVSASSPETVGSTKKTSTPNTSDRSTKTKTTNLNLTANSHDMTPTNTTELVKHVGSHRKARLTALETRQGNEGKCRN